MDVGAAVRGRLQAMGLEGEAEDAASEEGKVVELAAAAAAT
jgi:hypothetical protein